MTKRIDKKAVVHGASQSGRKVLAADKIVGSTPAGASDQESAARAVRQMFDEIAPRYDFLNHTLSMNVDRLWWRRTARTFLHILEREGAIVLDLCAGTGDMSVALRAAALHQRKNLPAAEVRNWPALVALDFSHQMLEHGLRKFRARGIQPVEADALRLPLADHCLDLVVSAFGFRNLADYDAGLREIWRVLKSGGEFGILDFSEPGGLLGQLYGVYFRKVLPRIGTWISGVRGPYQYLPASVGKFPQPSEMIERMKAAGFSKLTWTKYTFGIAGLYRGTKDKP